MHKAYSCDVFVPRHLLGCFRLGDELAIRVARDDRGRLCASEVLPLGELRFTGRLRNMVRKPGSVGFGFIDCWALFTPAMRSDIFLHERYACHHAVGDALVFEVHLGDEGKAYYAKAVCARCVRTSRPHPVRVGDAW